MTVPRHEMKIPMYRCCPWSSMARERRVFLNPQRFFFPFSLLSDALFLQPWMKVMTTTLSPDSFFLILISSSDSSSWELSLRGVFFKLPMVQNSPMSSNSMNARSKGSLVFSALPSLSVTDGLHGHG